ncbi:uncharacterized protein F5147DRAFT_679651 [Suillus discolor]|uniref:Hydrophobin n=1 Tax=Suillus discolor TaxID=1912936 RepID=A0A9P7JXN0_9AGAM|nr:uncharacterized protein F5147DRAFT_679651 [Suillus discolor]KAG2113759.1 hypothetical protein F5147DRAFT_679651 [Suillus discolor]
MHLPSVVAVASALIALVSAGPVNIDRSEECPISCETQDCCPGQECIQEGIGVVAQLVMRMNAMSTTVSGISTSISIGADDG